MKMTRFNTYCMSGAVLSVLLLVSCRREENVNFQPVGLAVEAVSDTASAAAGSLAGYQDVGNAAAIASDG